MPEDTYISARQLGRMLNLSRGSIYKMRRTGEIPEGVKIGSARRWSMSELRTFLKGGANV